MKKIFDNLLNGKDLNLKQSKELVESIFYERISDLEISSILTLLNIKIESGEEIFSFVNFLRKKCIKFPLKGNFMDTCGTGGDNKNSFNISTATSILLSACDVKIVKHGNRSVTSKSGSFDVLEALGININLNINQQKEFFKKNGICFLFAPKFHESLKKVGYIRNKLPFRTIFNLLGPLLNPCKLKYQLLGVSKKENLKTHSLCLSKMQINKAWVVYNLNGYDEITTISPNKIIEVKGDKIFSEKELNPCDFGFRICNENDLKGGSPEENAFIMRRLFEGETGPIRDNVIFNTAAGLLVNEKVKNLNEGIEFAKNNIDNGKAIKKLEGLIN